MKYKKVGFAVIVGVIAGVIAVFGGFYGSLVVVIVLGIVLAVGWWSDKKEVEIDEELEYEEVKFEKVKLELGENENKIDSRWRNIPHTDKGTLTINNQGIIYSGKKYNFRIPSHDIMGIGRKKSKATFIGKGYICLRYKENQHDKKIFLLGDGFAEWSGYTEFTVKKNTNKIYNALKEWEKGWNSFTNLNLEIDTIELRPEEWIEENITVCNSGNLPAFHIDIQSEGDIDLEQESPIDKLEAGQKRVEKVYIKGDKTEGNVPLELKLIYQNQYGVTQSLNQTVWTKVTQSKDEEEQKQKEETPPPPEPQSQKKESRSHEEIRQEIEQLQNEEEMIDVRAVVSSLKGGNVERADKLLSELEAQYQEYKDTLERLEEVDDKLADLSEKLASGEISDESFRDAKEGLKSRKYKLEEKLNKLREEVIHEDYEKPF